MSAKRYEVELKGVTPLLMHQDNILWGERVRAWTKDPANKKMSVSGDDRSPSWTWIGYVYHADEHVCVDADNLMAMLRDAGKKCPAARGKGSLKAATQSGIVVDQIGWPIVTTKGLVSWDKIKSMSDESDFEKHEKLAESLGFELFVKRAKIGTSKHVRVRPRFFDWSVKGSITVLDESLSPSIIQTVFDQGGRFVGLCDWRPGSMASGRYGMFTSTIKEV